MAMVISSFTKFRMLSGHAERQLSTFKDYQSDLQYTDVVLVCGDGKEVVQVHAVMIRAISDYMETLLADYCSTSMVGPATTSAFIYLPDFSADCIRTFIEMIYTGKVTLGSLDDINQVSELMTMLGVKAGRLDNQHSPATVQSQETNYRDRADNLTRRNAVSRPDRTEGHFSQAVSRTSEQIVSSPAHCDQGAPIVDLDCSSSTDELLTSAGISFNSNATEDQEMIDEEDDEVTICDYELVFNEEEPSLLQTSLRGTNSRRKLRYRQKMANIEDHGHDVENDVNLSNPEVGAAHSEVNEAGNSVSTDPDSIVSMTVPVSNNQGNKRMLMKATTAENEELNDLSKFDHLFAFSTPRDDSSQAKRKRTYKSTNNSVSTLDSFNSSYDNSKSSESPSVSPALACPLCPKVFRRRLYLQYHCADHFMNRIRSNWMTKGDLRCSECGYEATRGQSLVRHIGTTHRVVMVFFEEMGIDASDLFKKPPRISLSSSQEVA